MCKRHRLIAAALTVFVLSSPARAASDDALVAHWKLVGDCRDSSGHELHGVNHGADLAGPDGARFDGRDDWIEVPSSAWLQPGKGDFSVAVWIHTADKLDDVLGDVLSKFDPATRTGASLGLMCYAGVTNAQSNWRNVSFGIDAGRIEPEWTDCGRPGKSWHVRSLAVFDGNLYAATWEPEEGLRGHVYRYGGGQKWIDCGGPDAANTISALAVSGGKLYAGAERYSGAGSSLPASTNLNPGGKVYRYEGGTNWTDCGRVAEGVVSISGLATFNGQLYAGTGTTGSEHPTPRTHGMYRYEGGTKWVSCGCPGKRIVHLGVYNGHLYGLSYDGGNVFRYDGEEKWTDLGVPPETTQSYSFMVYEGKMHVATWPKATVFRFDDPAWTSIGRLGDEKEAMGISIYNGALYVGTLPLAEVYRHDGGTTWTRTGRLDMTPDVVYRRAWSMAVFQGRLYCGLLPSGKVFSIEAGKCVTLDRELPPGWQHLAAVKSGDRLKLYVNGQCVATSSAFDPAALDVSNDQPLRIGFGRHDYFNGKMRDLRIYGAALDDVGIGRIVKETQPTGQ
jgi:hypothetical protein